MSSHQMKLEDRSLKGVLLGYEEGSKAYRVFDPSKGKVLISRDVVFEEGASWPWQNSKKKEESDCTETFSTKVKELGG